MTRTGIRAQYTARRDLLVDLFHEHFDIRSDLVSFGPGAGVRAMPGMVGYAKRSGKGEKHSADRIISFVPPTSGMFVCVRSLPAIRYCE